MSLTRRRINATSSLLPLRFTRPILAFHPYWLGKLVREYFYRIPHNAGSSDRQTLYDILRMSSAASPGELRLGFKLRQLELKTKHAQSGEHVLLERAFNILGDPAL